MKNIDLSLEEILNNKISQNIKNVIDPGNDYIPVTGKVLDNKDILLGVDSLLDCWLTSGRYTKEFEKNLAQYIGAKRALLVNSGSSANLNAFYTLTSPLL